MSLQFEYYHPPTPPSTGVSVSGNDNAWTLNPPKRKKACSYCRSLHLKCSLSSFPPSISSCSRCLKDGKDCRVGPDRKRGAKEGLKKKKSKFRYFDPEVLETSVGPDLPSSSRSQTANSNDDITLVPLQYIYVHKERYERDGTSHDSTIPQESSDREYSPAGSTMTFHAHSSYSPTYNQVNTEAYCYPTYYNA